LFVVVVGSIVVYKAGQLLSPQGGRMNKKDISMAVMATVIVLQLVGGFFGGVVKDVTDGIAEALSSRVQIEKILSDDY
jgi:hypothetical protein